MFTEQQYNEIQRILVTYTMPKDQLGFLGINDLIRMIDEAINGKNHE